MSQGFRLDVVASLHRTQHLTKHKNKNYEKSKGLTSKAT